MATPSFVSLQLSVFQETTSPRFEEVGEESVFFFESNLVARLKSTVFNAFHFHLVFCLLNVTLLSVINIIYWGVWLGRHIRKTITQVFQDKLRKNRNLSSTIKRKACLILIFSTNTNRESVIQRSFKLCKETLTNLYLEVSEKLPKG